MKKTFIALLIISLLGIVSTYASEDDYNSDNSERMEQDYEDNSMYKTWTWRDWKPSWTHIPTVKPKMLGEGKEEREQMKQEWKQKREDMKKEIKENRDEMKNNRKEFRDEHKDDMKALSWTLSEDQRTQVKALHEAHKTEMEALMSELKSVKGDDAKMKEIFVKIEAARAAHLDKLKTIVGENSEFAKIVDARKGVFEENKALREENRSKREEWRDGIEDKVVKYKGIFVQKIAKKLEKLNTTQIQKIIDKVDAQLTKVEANTILSQENKDKLKAQLVALRETLEDRLDTSDAEQDMIEVQSMIESVGQ